VEALLHRTLSDLRATLDAKGTVTVAGLGDSLTCGWRVTTSFFELFCRDLEKRWPDAEVRWIEAGVPGETASDGFDRVDEILVYEPDLVVVEFAINDGFLGVPMPSFVADLEDIVDVVRRAGAVPFLVTPNHLRLVEDRALIGPYYQAIRELGERMDVAVADLEARMEGEDLVQDDGVHPSDEGHQRMAEGLMGRFLEG